VVVVFVSVLSIAAGFRGAMQSSGSPSRALVLRTGADSEMTSGFGGEDADVIKQAPGLRRDGQTAVASAELYVIIDLPKRSTGTAANVPMRGVEQTALSVRDEVSIVEGRMFEFGTNEVVVGRGASGQFAGLTVGSTVRVQFDSLTDWAAFADGAKIAQSEKPSKEAVFPVNRTAHYRVIQGWDGTGPPLDAFDAVERTENGLFGLGFLVIPFVNWYFDWMWAFVFLIPIILGILMLSSKHKNPIGYDTPPAGFGGGKSTVEVN